MTQARREGGEDATAATPLSPCLLLLLLLASPRRRRRWPSSTSGSTCPTTSRASRVRPWTRDKGGSIGTAPLLPHPRTESGKDLVAASGPGRIGASNLGNTCYLNSVVQVCAPLNERTCGRRQVVYPVYFCFRRCSRLSPRSARGTAAATVRRDGYPGGCPRPAATLPLFPLQTPSFAPARRPQPTTSSRRRALLPLPSLGALTARWPTAAPQFSKFVRFLQDGRYAADEATLLRRRAAAAAAAASAPPAADAPIEPGPGGACGYVTPRMFKTVIGKGHAEFAGALGNRSSMTQRYSHRRFPQAPASRTPSSSSSTSSRRSTRRTTRRGRTGGTSGRRRRARRRTSSTLTSRCVGGGRAGQERELLHQRTPLPFAPEPPGGPELGRRALHVHARALPAPRHPPRPRDQPR